VENELLLIEVNHIAVSPRKSIPCYQSHDSPTTSHETKKMNTEDSATLKKIAFPVVIVITALLIVFRLTVFDNQDSVSHVVAGIIDNLVATLIAAIAVTLFILYLGQRTRKVNAYFTRGKQLKQLLVDDSMRSHTWRIRARTGSYFVRETMPKLGTKNDAVIDVILMDPSRTEDLATYRNLRPTEEQHNWDPLRIQADVFVSIIRLIQYRNTYSFMTINLYTAATAWAQSLDISDNNCFLCGQAKGDLALICPESDELYASFIDDFRVAKTFACSRPLPVMADIGAPTGPILTPVMHMLKSTFVDWFGLDVTERNLSRKIVERSTEGYLYG
jgi:hypothetical protein